MKGLRITVGLLLGIVVSISLVVVTMLMFRDFRAHSNVGNTGTESDRTDG